MKKRIPSQVKIDLATGNGVQEFIKDQKESLGEVWWKIAEEAYGFAYACQHAGIDPTCQEFLSDQAQADLLNGIHPAHVTRMCEECWEAFNAARVN